MARSKRAQVITISKVKKKGIALKKNLDKIISQCMANYRRLAVIQLENPKAPHIQRIRANLNSSKVVFGKKKVNWQALERSYVGDVCKLGDLKTCYFTNDCVALLFTNLEASSISQTLDEISAIEFAKAGFPATKTVILQEGEHSLRDIHHSLESSLRELGLPTLLKGGKIVLMGTTTICTENTPLTMEAAQILKLLNIKMTQFRVNCICNVQINK